MSTTEGKSTIRTGLLVLLPPVLVLGLIAAIIVLPAERRNSKCSQAEDRYEAGCMEDVGDALYWAFTTATTTGYGDLTPHSGTARAVASLLMLFGVTFWAALISISVTALQQNAAARDATTRGLAARIFGSSQPSEQDQLFEIRQRLDELLKRVPMDPSATGSVPQPPDVESRQEPSSTSGYCDAQIAEPPTEPPPPDIVPKPAKESDTHES